MILSQSHDLSEHHCGNLRIFLQVRDKFELWAAGIGGPGQKAADLLKNCRASLDGQPERLSLRVRCALAMLRRHQREVQIEAEKGLIRSEVNRFKLCLYAIDLKSTYKDRWFGL